MIERYSGILANDEGFSWKEVDISLEFWKTKETILENLSLSSSFFVLKTVLLFLKEIAKVTVKLFSTICFVLCHSAPPEAENLTNFPSTRSILPTGQRFKKFLKPT